tara:strand:- start:42 stop:671 length:630 start_codon:yes stop_codon:yes gene_type:complete
MMGEGDQPNVSPEDHISQLEQQARKDEEAIQKLLQAYKGAEADLEAMKNEIAAREEEIVEMMTTKAGLDTLLGNLRTEKDEMEVKLAKADAKMPYLENKLQKTEEMLRVEEARTGRIMDVAEEIHEEREAAVAELAARDDWYVQHMQVFEDLNKAIQTRYDMIDRAIVAAKELAAQTDTFREMRESVIEAIKDKEEEKADEEEAAEEEG